MNNPVETTTQLIGHLNRAQKLVEARLNALLEPVGLTCTQHKVLQYLIQSRDPVSLSTLTEALGTVRSNTTQMVDRLVAEGLVERILDPVDRRRVLARVCEVGRTRCEEASRIERQVAGELEDQFSLAQQEELSVLLGRLEKVWD